MEDRRDLSPWRPAVMRGTVEGSEIQDQVSTTMAAERVQYDMLR